MKNLNMQIRKGFDMDIKIQWVGDKYVGGDEKTLNKFTMFFI
jgi:hypothetical protein